MKIFKKKTCVVKLLPNMIIFTKIDQTFNGFFVDFILRYPLEWNTYNINHTALTLRNFIIFLPLTILFWNCFHLRHSRAFNSVLWRNNWRNRDCVNFKISPTVTKMLAKHLFWGFGWRKLLIIVGFSIFSS